MLSDSWLGWVNRNSGKRLERASLSPGSSAAGSVAQPKVTALLEAASIYNSLLPVLVSGSFLYLLRPRGIIGSVPTTLHASILPHPIYTMSYGLNHVLLKDDAVRIFSAYNHDLI